MRVPDIAAVIETKDRLVRDLLPDKVDHGVLIPLKTTLELRDAHSCGQALITRAPTKSASAVISTLQTLLPAEVVNGLSHLRRCAKPCDLPSHLKAHLMNDSPQSRQMHTGKAAWVYIMLGIESLFDMEELFDSLSRIDNMGGEPFVATIPVPLLPPTSQVQAALWCSQFWPTVYRKTNPLGPHPSLVARSTDDIAVDAAIWMGLAHMVAAKARKAGLGLPIGACIIQRMDDGQTKLVALAADARLNHWGNAPTGAKGDACCSTTGNPIGHAVLRAISMVAKKLVRAERRASPVDGDSDDDTEMPALKPQAAAAAAAAAAMAASEAHRIPVKFDPFQDDPLLEEERLVFEADHPSPEGYLCHGLELYLTHEPCVMCAMSILHSRMGKVILAERMPLTGGICSEDRALDTFKYPDMANFSSGGHGLGLFWRRELNWSLLGWEWEPCDGLKPEQLPPTTHA
ncbi:hypothetical protein RB595_004727 [Gaeumannomyces hyphopodioides]